MLDQAQRPMAVRRPVRGEQLRHGAELFVQEVVGNLISAGITVSLRIASAEHVLPFAEDVDRKGFAVLGLLRLGNSF